MTLRRREYLIERVILKMASEVSVVLKKNGANMPGTMMDISPTEWNSADKKMFIKLVNELDRGKVRGLNNDISDGIDSSSGDTKDQFKALWNLLGR